MDRDLNQFLMVLLKYRLLQEVQNERDGLQDQVAEQLVLISSLQMRLDDQRLRVEHVQKQTNTSLEVRIYDLENEIQSLRETVVNRDKTVSNLNKVLEDTKKKLLDREEELNALAEDKHIPSMQMEIDKLRAEKVQLQNQIEVDARNVEKLPNIFNNILADKNKDIETLREKLDKTESSLNEYLSLNLDRDELKSLRRLKTSDTDLSNILSLLDLDETDKLRATPARDVESLYASTPGLIKRNKNETVFVGPEISSIEKVGPEQPYHTSMARPANSTEKSLGRRVQFEDAVLNSCVEKLETEVVDLKNQLQEKEEVIKGYMLRLNILNSLEATIEDLQKKLDYTQSALEKASETCQKEQHELKRIQDDLNIELAERKLHLIESQKQVEALTQDAARKDQMYFNLAKEKRDLEKQFNVHSNEQKQLEDTIDRLKKSCEVVPVLELELKNKEEQATKLKEQVQALEKQIQATEEVNSKLEKNLKNKESQLNTLESEMRDVRNSLAEKNKEVQTLKSESVSSGLKELKALLVDRETEIEILNEDVTRYQDEIAGMEEKLKAAQPSNNELQLAKSKQEVVEKNLIITDMNSEIEDLQR